jgi:hypothetical protein
MAETAVRPWTRPYDWAEVVLGVVALLSFLMFVSPWVMGYTELDGISWSSWIIGALTVIVGAAALPAAQAAHRSGVAGQH